MISIICRLTHDSYIDFLNCLNFNGLKEPQVQWDPGGSELVGSSTSTTWGQAVFQGGRGVRVPPYTSTWVWAWLALKDSSWAGPYYRPLMTELQVPDAGQRGNLVIQEVKARAAGFLEVSFTHENRQSNSEAHSIARSVISCGFGRQVWLIQPPDGLCIPNNILEQ